MLIQKTQHKPNETKNPIKHNNPWAGLFLKNPRFFWTPNIATKISSQVLLLMKKSASATKGAQADSVDDLFRNERHDDREEHKRDEN